MPYTLLFLASEERTKTDASYLEADPFRVIDTPSGLYGSLASENFPEEGLTDTFNDMKLDATDLRYITADEFRTLAAVEQGSRNHLTVPTTLIAQISKITGGQVNRCLSSLAKRGLVGRVIGAKYDGYRLTYGGLDYLALKTFSKRTPLPTVSSVGNQIGVGKEGDIYVVRGKGKRRLEEGDVPNNHLEDYSEAGPSYPPGSRLAGSRSTMNQPAQGQSQDEDEEEEEAERILKIHRLGRISFRAIKSKRDYLGDRKSASWMYMSRLAARKEWEFMKALYDHGFPVPEPIDHARHCIIMSLIEGFPLRQIAEDACDPADLYAKLMDILVRIAYAGLIHGDYNEFNIMIREENFEPIVIDFPQMVSTRHANAKELFERDVKSIRKFFRKRFRFESEEYPIFEEIMKDIAEIDNSQRPLSSGALASNDRETETQEDRPKRFHLDQIVEASGFSRSMQKELEQYMEDAGELPSENTDYISEGSSSEGEEEAGSSSEDGASSSGESDESDDEVPELADRFQNARLNAIGDDRRTVASRASKTSRRTHRSERSEVSEVVSTEMIRSRLHTEKMHHSRKGISQAGKVKGAKWKSSAAGQIGKQSGFW